MSYRGVAPRRQFKGLLRLPIPANVVTTRCTAIGQAPTRTCVSWDGGGVNEAERRVLRSIVAIKGAVEVTAPRSPAEAVYARRPLRTLLGVPI